MWTAPKSNSANFLKLFENLPLPLSINVKSVQNTTIINTMKLNRNVLNV